ncbi:Asp-tRNA(Asn)/Glu-tRNA(Gln) amidotransferase subunit GatB [Patescibacteria group bacterium]|nr:Asp-tRNA(Asn)/Glu-tRNA(Gln) amidotransferase subunit GatB [Patescibacteria group bacterium]
MQLETIIGLEIHIQMKTKSKMFCSCSNTAEDQKPNTAVCPICLGHPGTLPRPNKRALEMGVIMALALDCTINKKSIWERKNYFYPDLAKGYQISQFEAPLAKDGHLTIELKDEKKRIEIERLHLEEDAAKNFHSKEATLVDFNRSGTPLMEIVTQPEFNAPQEAKQFLQDLRLLARYLKVSDADMEKGHLRCDANISLRPAGEKKMYAKTEIKNLNSFRSVERALEYEVKRQTRLWDLNTPPTVQSTRGWDEKELKTVEQRTKEESSDYRYFPEPDLPAIEFTDKEIQKIRAELPELPNDKKERFKSEYKVSAADAKVLMEDKDVSDYFEQVMSEARAWLESLDESIGTSDEVWELNKQRLTKLVTGWLLSELFKLMNEADVTINEVKITPENFAEFIAIVYQRKINSSSAQVLLKEMFQTGGDPSQIMEEQDLSQVGDEGQLSDIIDKIIKDNPEQVKEYQAGKTPLIKFFIGQAMKETKGKANPQILEKMFRRKLI